MAPALAAPSFPPLTGRVVDQANIIPAATRAELDGKLAALEARTTDQLVVVTLSSLQGYEIADYGYQLGRAWGIGQKGKNNGVLLIVAPKEHDVRIEVGYGLEGDLTDAVTKIIIDQATTSSRRSPARPRPSRSAPPRSRRTSPASARTARAAAGGRSSSSS